MTGVPLTPASLILALVQQTLGGRQVVAALPDVANSQFTLVFNRAPRVNVLVGWFVAN